MATKIEAAETKITKEAIEEERNQRASACGEKIKSILEEYECELVAIPQITPAGAITSTVQLKSAR